MALKQIFPPLGGSLLSLSGSPGGNLLVIPAQQNFWDDVTTKLTRSGVLGKLQEFLVRKRILLAALFIAQCSGQQSHGGLDDGHGGNLASIENEVTQADLKRLENVDDSLVKTFVAAAQ
jgi:hypothetical protein